MRYFVTGASGWIGSAVVAELLEAGHEVVGLARSDASAERVRALGADVHRGELDDLESLVAGAAASDGVVHLGYNHDFSRMGEAAQTDLAAINAIGGALEGTDRPLLIASGTLGLATGRVATEEDAADPSSHPRIAGAQAALGFAERGVRSIVTRFAPTVHGPGDPGFVAVLVAKARETGVAGYVGDGSNRWPAVHRLDAARLVRLAVEGAPAGLDRARDGGGRHPDRADRGGDRPGARHRDGVRRARALRLARAVLRRGRPGLQRRARERCSAGSRGSRADRGHPATY